MRPGERKARCEHSCAGLFASFLPGPQSEISANSLRGDKVGVRGRPSKFPTIQPWSRIAQEKKEKKEKNKTLRAKGPKKETHYTQKVQRAGSSDQKNKRFKSERSSGCLEIPVMSCSSPPIVAPIAPEDPICWKVEATSLGILAADRVGFDQAGLADAYPKWVASCHFFCSSPFFFSHFAIRWITQAVIFSPFSVIKHHLERTLLGLVAVSFRLTPPSLPLTSIGDHKPLRSGIFSTPSLQAGGRVECKPHPR